MSSTGKPSRPWLFGIAVAGILLEVGAILLLLLRDVSVAAVAPLMIIGMFMSFAPAIAARKSGPTSSDP